MWHGKRDVERSVVTGPRLRGDDAESVGRALALFTAFFVCAPAALARSFVQMKTLPIEHDMKSLYTEQFLPTK
jgi:hypothetical protein